MAANMIILSYGNQHLKLCLVTVHLANLPVTTLQRHYIEIPIQVGLAVVVQESCTDNFGNFVNCMMTFSEIMG